MNRVTETSDPKNQIVQKTYDSEGSVDTYIDPNDNTYMCDYDLDERQTSLQYPDESTEDYTYDPVGNTLSHTTRDGKIQSFDYDSRNRNTEYSWNDSVTPAVTTEYDNAGRVTTLGNANSIISYTYDNANETLNETEDVTGLGNEAVRQAYNTNGTVNTITYPDNTVLTYGYNNRNQVTSIEQGSSNVVNYTYDSNGNRNGKTLANGVVSTLTYDAVERLTTIVDITPSPEAGTQLQSFAYGYDAMSRRTYVQRNGALGDVYGYDNSDQLTEVEYNATNPNTSPTNPSRTVNYTYDASGNRTGVTDSVNGNTGYATNDNNQYTTVGGSALTYDGKGNLSTYQGWTYTYDAQNRLIEATNGLNTITFGYDPLGRCVQRNANGTLSFLVYDMAWNIIGDYDGNGHLTNRYVHGAATDEMLTKTDNSGNIIYYHNDALGSVTMLTNSSGVPLEQYSYDVYGEPTIMNAAGTTITNSAYGNRFLFTGREYLAALDCYDYRMREYSATLGRFFQPDPKGHSGDAYNLNRYCGNNPVNQVDPMGTDHGDGNNSNSAEYPIDDPENPYLNPLDFPGNIEIINLDGNSTTYNNQSQDDAVESAIEDGDPMIGTLAPEMSVDDEDQSDQDDQSSADSSNLGFPHTPNPFLDILGKIWNLPNTILGLVIGAVGFIAGEIMGTNPQISLGDNAIQFTNLPFGNSALTLGNVQLYAQLPNGEGGPSGLSTTYADENRPQNEWTYVITGQHEEAHTLQSQALGPFFLPAYFLMGGISAANPFENAADQYGLQQAGYWPR